MTSSSPVSLREYKFEHILLWMPNWIGDVALSIPTIQSLRAHYPGARITAAARGPAGEILSDHPAVDTVIQVPSEESGILGQIQFARSLKKYQFDLGVVFPNSFRSAVMAFLSGAKTRLGYDTEGRSMFLTNPIPATPASKTQYRVDYFFNIVSLLGLPPLEGGYHAFIKKETQRAVGERLARIGVDKYDFLVAVHPSSSKPERSWHAERFAILCQRLIKEYRTKIILLGNEKDSGLLEGIRRSCPPGMVHSLADLSLRESVAAIEKSKLFIGNDSGMMHLAAMVGVPIVAVFGPGRPATTGPFIDPGKKTAVTKNFPCSPCRQKFFKECKPSAHNKPYCLEDISVKEVAEAAESMIRKIRKP